MKPCRYLELVLLASLAAGSGLLEARVSGSGPERGKATCSSRALQHVPRYSFWAGPLRLRGGVQVFLPPVALFLRRLHLRRNVIYESLCHTPG
jgi:hypothetical protein